MAAEIIATVVDKSGDKGTTSIKVTVGTIAAMTTFAATWATALNNFISGKIMSAIAYIVLDGVGLLTDNTLFPNSDVEHTAKFRFRTVNGNPVNLSIPAIDESIVDAYASDTLDQSLPETAAIIAAMVAGITTAGGLIQPCDIGSGNITSVVFARESFKNSGARR